MHEYELASFAINDEIAALIPGPSTAELAFLPERLDQVSGQRVAAFRPTAHELRVVLRNGGLDPALIVPDGYRKGSWQEHSDTWVLPVILTAATVPVTVLANLMTTWLQSKFGGGDDRATLVYREIEIRPDGHKRFIEVRGKPSVVIRALEERAAWPPDDST